MVTINEHNHITLHNIMSFSNNLILFIFEGWAPYIASDLDPPAGASRTLHQEDFVA